jgi:hypothetical protein
MLPKLARYAWAFPNSILGALIGSLTFKLPILAGGVL